MLLNRPMPDKPTWCGDLDTIARDLRALPDPWIDRSTLEQLLGIGRRRAQQILAPCVGRQVGVNGMADREVVIAHLVRLTAGDTAHYENQRRSRLAEHLGALQSERRKALLVEAPAAIVNQELGICRKASPLRQAGLRSPSIPPNRRSKSSSPWPWRPATIRCFSSGWPPEPE